MLVSSDVDTTSDTCISLFFFLPIDLLKIACIFYNSIRLALYIYVFLFYWMRYIFYSNIKCVHVGWVFYNRSCNVIRIFVYGIFCAVIFVSSGVGLMILCNLIISFSFGYRCGGGIREGGRVVVGLAGCCVGGQTVAFCLFIAGDYYYYYYQYIHTYSRIKKLCFIQNH